MHLSGTKNTGPRLAFFDCPIGASGGAGGGSGNAQAQGRREVVISGKRVKTIDSHAHCIVPAAAELINHAHDARGLRFANYSASPTVDIDIVQELPRSKCAATLHLSNIHSFLKFSKSHPRVRHSILNSLAHLRRKLCVFKE